MDLETYSSIDISTSGSYKYFESPDFEILILAYAFDNEEVKVVDLAAGEVLPKEFLKALLDPTVEKHAHNASFERNAFRAIGYNIAPMHWRCTAIKAAYCGLPLSLSDVSKAMRLEEKGKLAEGKALIRFFSCPVKPTKANGMKLRNTPSDYPEKWELYKEYCKQDVEAEREIDLRLDKYIIPKFERLNYILDQKINDRGVQIDLGLAQYATEMDITFSDELENKVKRITGIANANSPLQLKNWLSNAIGKEIKSLAKGEIPDLIKLAGEGSPASEVLRIRQKLAKSSTKKYIAMLNCACEDGRARGLFQFYGANRTGRSSGRLIQLQNLPQNHIDDLEETRAVIASGDYDLACMLYDDLPSILSQLIRTTIITPLGRTFIVSDFSAIEARVIAWLAEEDWRMEVFASHGKIYEASAAMMFNVPIESITKGSPLRQKGKIAELALGYQGGVGALETMGGASMGLSQEEMKTIVNKWRQANPSIVALWSDLEKCAIRALKRKEEVISKFRGIKFDYNGEVLTIELPSGRKLFYQEPSFTINKFGSQSIRYKGLNQETKQWGYVDTYGGKIVENCVQGIARDLLMEAMLRLNQNGFDIVLHVHDEVVCETDLETAEGDLEEMSRIMAEEVVWAKGLLLPAEGFISEFYKKE